MKIVILGAFIIFSLAGFSQKPTTSKSDDWQKIYRASATKINDLVNTKLEVNFDYSKSWMAGKAWITLHPHFYATDSLNLDAKGMEIKEVSIISSGKNTPLKYNYDSHNLRIQLNRTYLRDEKYTVFIDYISKPNEIKEKGSGAISGAKGLYFINPLGKEKNKPTQIWTQGETESNSCWFPTIDKPNQKTTDEISMTVPDKYQTLSNGLLVRNKKNRDGTRTDTWKMDLPIAPYLVMMTVGEYSIVKDHYKNKEVSYYVEKEYAPVARKIFGLTPEMIAFYSRILGVDYPWQKYAQIVGRDYISGAMENATATLMGEFVQQDARQLIDGNSAEDVIAHELFHHWFGDYVTCESWSNLTINESFADFSETLWEEYKHGQDAGAEQNYNAMLQYLRRGAADKDLVRFYYRNQMDMFDAISYQKGGRILNMLRNEVGDEAFYKSLNLFLNEKKFQSAEAQELRLAFEQVTGQDLNWFWNQWYYGSGHPVLDISYAYDASTKTAKVFLKQNQADKVFQFKIAVDVYQGGEKKRYPVFVDQAADTLTFPAATQPDLINVDGDKILLCDKTDHKTLDNFIFQYKNAGLYVDRREAIDYAATKQSTDPIALEFLKTALNDPYPGLRIYAIQHLNIRKDSVKKVVETLLADLAKNDPKTTVRAAAIGALGNYKKADYKDFFLKAVNDSSYSIAGNSLLALGSIDSIAALNQAKILDAQNVKGALSDAINECLFRFSGENEFDALAARFENLDGRNAKFNNVQPFANFLKRVNNTANFKKGIDLIVAFRDSIPEAYRRYVLPFLNDRILKSIAAAKEMAGMNELADYVNSKLPPKPASYVVSPESLEKYAGEYKFGNKITKVILLRKTLNIKFPTDSSVFELTPISKNKFSVSSQGGLMVEFTVNEKNEVTEMLSDYQGGQIKGEKIN